MQRRAAAVSVAFFVLVSAASYALVATAHEPGISFDDPAYTLQQGQSFEVGGQSYTVTSVSAEVTDGGGGGHGGGGGGELVRSGELTWTDQDARQTATWDNGSSVTVGGEAYTVVVDAGDEPSAFVLREEINRTAVLQDDSRASTELVTIEDREYVLLTVSASERVLVPASEYFPTPDELRYEEGESFTFEDREVTVDDVSPDAVTLAWTVAEDRTVSLSNEANVTLQDTTYFVFFPDNSTVELTQDFASYDRQTDRIDRFHDQERGLWGVSILSALAAVLLLGMAYLPSRY